MLTKEQILEQILAGKKSATMDGRDFSRLSDFFEVEQLEKLGFKLNDDADPSEWEVKEWNRDNIMAQLTHDLSFAFEKALNKRGLSAGMMHDVVKMWMWVLEDDLHDKAADMYPQYGLPFLKAVAVKYDLPNEIGDDDGDEDKYSADYEEY